MITFVPADATVSCSGEVPGASDALVTATDNCGGVVTITHLDDNITTGSCANRYTITRTYIATDVCGNSSSQNQTITVNDQTAPVITFVPADATLSCSGEVPGANDALVTATDNCGGVVTITHLDDNITTGSCANRYTITRTYIATDVCGNSSSQNQTITVNDQTAPVITFVPADATLSCSGEVPGANDALVTATDNCGGVVTITHLDDNITTGSCANRYTITRTYIATDVCGNSSSQNQTITVNDQTAPVITFVPADATLSCSGEVPGANDALVTATDNCGGLVTITHLDDNITTGTCANRYTITRTYIATDVCGNSSSQNQTITVDDQTAPVITFVPADATLSCSGEVPGANDALVTATDNCGGVVTITHLDDNITTGTCANRYTITRTYIATDVCGNSSSQNQTITVNDQTAPVITFVPADATLSCSGEVPGANDALVTATDNCGGVVTITHLDDNITTGSCANRYTITRTYIATDVCGNSSSQNQTITVNDQTAPVITFVPADATVSCSGEVPGANDALVTATDNCGGVVTITHLDDNITTGTCANRYTITRTYIATDVCGNSSSQNQTITVNDQTAPVITMFPANTTVSCSGEVPGASDALVTATDNCGGVVTITHLDDDITTGTCVNRYTITRTYIATDVCGNSSSQSQTISVNDQTAPVLSATPANVTVECDDIPVIPGITATDNCSGLTPVTFTESSTQVADELDCGHYNYMITRTWTTTDECGNSTSHSQAITVQDNTGPTLTQVGIINTCYTTNGTAVDAIEAAVTFSDNCASNDNLSRSTTTAQIGASCNYKITRTISDPCGNSSSLIFFVKIDNTPPIIVTPASSLPVECDGAGNIAQLNAWLADNGGADATDGCSGVSWTNNSATASWVNDCGNSKHISIIFTATDGCGHTSTTSAIFTIVDTTPPVIGTQADDETVECDGTGNTAAYAEWLASNGGAAATDVCGGVNWTNNSATALWVSDCGNSKHISITFTASDGCGNTSTTSATFAIEDTEAPIVLTAEGADANIGCNPSASDKNEAFIAPEFADDCGFTVTVATSHTGTGCTQSDTRTWTASDGCGHTASVSQTISYTVDTDGPVISTLPVPSTISCPDVPSFATPTATDACDNNVALISADVTTPGSCAGTYSTTRTWTATDDCGNTATASQTITVQDITAPVISTLPAPSTINCPDVPSFATPTATDACDATVALTSADVTTTGSCAGTYSVTRTWTATDDCGNTSTASQTINVQDITAPVISALPAPSTINCPAVPSFATPTATDACDTNVTLTSADVTTPGHVQEHIV